jgi:hypothetical protein
MRLSLMSIKRRTLESSNNYHRSSSRALTMTSRMTPTTLLRVISMDQTLDESLRIWSPSPSALTRLNHDLLPESSVACYSIWVSIRHPEYRVKRIPRVGCNEF